MPNLSQVKTLRELGVAGAFQEPLKTLALALLVFRRMEQPEDPEERADEDFSQAMNCVRRTGPEKSVPRDLSFEDSPCRCHLWGARRLALCL